MNKYIAGWGALLALLWSTVAGAGDYRSLKQDTFKGWLENGKPMQVVDIQLPAEFARHHFKGAIETGAYPVKTDVERQRLDAVLPAIKASRDDVVIVCPRGGGGARNTYDYLKAHGVAESRLFILEKGMDGWPYPYLTVSGR
jgi:rhodanese-related sulfurtransferase